MPGGQRTLIEKDGVSRELARSTGSAALLGAVTGRPRLLDLFCCAGGAAMGYHRAGFDVVGVDVRPQPRYPFEFIQADCLGLTAEFLAGFDAIHASPPCQHHTAMKTMHNALPHADLVPQTRAMLQASGKPYIIENVVGAPLEAPAVLCGTMFGLGVEDAELRRHRLFEASFMILAPTCQHGSRDVIGVYGGHVRNRRRARTIGVYGEGCRDSRRKFDKGVPDFSIDQGREAMGIDWMTTAELSQAIPPAYTEFLGHQLMRHLQLQVAA
jgi:DNA (cytosine-5)-methyltransferase 1